MNRIHQFLLACTGLLMLIVFLMECSSCGTDPKSETPTSTTFQNTVWTSQRLEFILTAPDGQDVRMNFPSGARDLQVEFLDKYFKMELGDEDFFGKFEVVGEERFITLKPDGKPNFNLEVNRDCSPEKLVLQLSKSESKEVFATLLITTNPYLPAEMVTFLNTGDVRLRFEFTRKTN